MRGSIWEKLAIVAVRRAAIIRNVQARARCGTFAGRHCGDPTGLHIGEPCPRADHDAADRADAARPDRRPQSSQPPSTQSSTSSSQSDEDKRTESDLLFKRLLAKPNDLDAAFRYASLQSDLGDYEAAIGALERMLYYQPDLPRVKLELGILYFHLRSYAMARSYFNAVLSYKDLPDDVRAEVLTYLSAVDRALATNQFSAFGQVGVRYQSNANAGPESSTVFALGQNALLSPQFQTTPDWNAFGVATAHYFYDFGDQRGDGWEADLVSYYSEQFKLKSLNLGLLELQTGPRIGIGGYGGLSVHPYALGNAMSLGPGDYLNTVGGGVSMHWPVNEALTLTPGFEYRDRWFYNSETYPTAAGQSGGEWIGYAIASGLISAKNGFTWQARVAFTDAQASYEPYAYHDLSVDVSLPYGFTAPHLRAYRHALGFDALGGIFLYALCRTRSADRSLDDPRRPAMARRPEFGYDLLREARLLAQCAISAHQLDRPELPHAGLHLLRRADDKVLSPALAMTARARPQSISTTRPSRSVTLRSMREARSRLWVAISAATRLACTSVGSVSNTWSAVFGSRLPVGSSASSTRGALASARAIATRCCSPPESSAGRWRARAPRPR